VVRGTTLITWGRLVVFAAGVVALVACSPGTTSSPSSGPSTPGTQASTSTSALSVADKAKQDALAAYLGMWQDFVVAGRTSDWQSTALGDHATGLALQSLSRGLYSDRYRGLVTKGEPILNPSVSSAEPADAPTKVMVTDCGDSTNWLKYRTDNGELADNEPGGRQLINAIVLKQADGSWKVSEYGVHQVGSC
jgi:hypothetical protein